MNDENIEETTSSESSTEINDSESVTEDVKKSEPMIPKSRFDEVLRKKNELEKQLGNQVPEKESNKPSEAVDASWKKWMEFTIENRNLDREELLTAKRLYEAGTPLNKVLEDPLYVAFSEKYSKEKAANEASPSSQRSPKGIASKPVEEMSDDEHKKFFEEVINS